MVNLRKISKIAELAFINSLRLHFDSVLLFNNKSYPSALFLSILAQEEVGKFYILDDFVWHSTVTGRCDIEQEKEWINQVLNHGSKQRSFIMQGGLFIDSASFPKKFIKDTFSKDLEALKQNSLYVGLPREKGGLKLGGKIKNPIFITKDKAFNQITIVSDYFIDYWTGFCKGIYGCDNEMVEKMLKDKQLLIRLESVWKSRGKRFSKKRVK